jgi:alcohol dehydrogenase
METNTPFEFKLKTHVVFGVEEALKLNEHLKGYKKIGIVVDKAVEKTGYWQRIYYRMSSLPIDSILLYDFGEPTYTLLEQKREQFKNIDIIVGIGGGSVIDFAKGLSFLTTNPKHAIEYRGFPTNVNKPTPVIAIPTTAGTGSEVTYNAVFIEEKEQKKLGINTTLNFPTLAILDPLLVQSCPFSVSVSSGLDALTHAVESYGATKSNTITRALSKEALNLLIPSLDKLYGNQSDLTICSNLMIGAYLAGVALMNSGSGPAGAMSYILGPKFNVPHGLAGAVFLPHIVKHNESYDFKYDNRNSFSDYLSHLFAKLYVDCDNLSQFNINESNVDILLKGVESLQPAFNQNPVPFSIENAKEIIRGMI